MPSLWWKAGSRYEVYLPSSRVSVGSLQSFSTLPIRAAQVQKPVLQKARLGQETPELGCQTKATYRPVRSRVTPLSAAHFTGCQFFRATYKSGNRCWLLKGEDE